MELKPITGQQGKSLLEFYDPKEWPEQWGKMPEMMCQLIKSLQKEDYNPIWVFTSHAELLFTDKDDYKEWKVLVRIIKMDGRQFYKVTAAQDNPWHHMTGFADNPISATNLVITGLRISVGGKKRNIFLDSN